MERGEGYAKVNWSFFFPKLKPTPTKDLLESLGSMTGEKKVVLGNAQCLARRPSLALAQLLRLQAGFQVHDFHQNFINNETFILSRWCKPQLVATWGL